MILTPAANPEATLDKAEKILTKYDYNVEVPEYSAYLDAEEVDRMKKHYDSADQNYLASKVSD